MIYTVECSFANPVTEEEWNDFYSLEKLPTLISVSGFHTAQRFRALSPGCPAYFAIYSIDSLDVLQSDEYAQKGGGNFALWQRYITDWHRNLYAGMDRAPAIGDDEYLVFSTVGPDPLIDLGLSPQRIHAVELAKFPEYRWLAKIRSPDSDMGRLTDGVYLYKPMTVQLTSRHESGGQASS